MSAFYVGQRVKKVRGDYRNIGLVGVVASFDHDWMWVLIESGVGVLSNGLPAPSGTTWMTPADDWEPILPPGLESLEEINALYEPIEVHA